MPILSTTINSEKLGEELQRIAARGDVLYCVLGLCDDATNNLGGCLGLKKIKTLDIEATIPIPSRFEYYLIVYLRLSRR